ncbi:hypothetical protein NL676_007699 [Syzygium grande]|nr:hypothetical protein NL676_007699 [Syzygium grande]
MDEEVCPTLVEAIGQLKISIPIISLEYAQRELPQVHAIVPIFCRLNPFADHRKRGSDGMLLNPLKSALLRVGQLEGYRLDHASDRLIYKLVLYVSLQLKEGASMPVGIDNQGTKRVKVDDSSDKCFTWEEFQSLSELRFLKLDNAYIQGDFTNLLSSLRWLDWQGCLETFEARNLHVKKLMILDLSRSKVIHKWKSWSQIKVTWNIFHFIDSALGINFV